LFFYIRIELGIDALVSVKPYFSTPVIGQQVEASLKTLFQS